MTTVLVVDDSAVDRRLIGELLERRFKCSVEYAVDGVEALAKMKDAAPDLVITDLTMPVMDGLELVRSLRTHHSDVPVILMTAFGSESLAVDALRQGAASYVPKSQVGEKLLDTVEEVLTLTRADRGHERLISCLAKTEFDFVLDNDPALIDPLVNLVQQMVSGMNLVDFTGRLQIGVALKEAILNSLFHGSLEITARQLEDMGNTLLQEGDESLVERRGSELPYRDRRIYVTVALSTDEARFTVRDQGPGFDLSQVPDLDEPKALATEGRRGLSLIRAFMDEVSFNDTGTEIRMVKLTGGSP